MQISKSGASITVYKIDIHDIQEWKNVQWVQLSKFGASIIVYKIYIHDNVEWQHVQWVQISKFGASIIVHVYKIYNLAPEEDNFHWKYSRTTVSLCFIALVSTFPWICSVLSTSPAVVCSFLPLYTRADGLEEFYLLCYLKQRGVVARNQAFSAAQNSTVTLTVSQSLARMKPLNLFFYSLVIWQQIWLESERDLVSEWESKRVCVCACVCVCVCECL